MNLPTATALLLLFATSRPSTGQLASGVPAVGPKITTGITWDSEREDPRDEDPGNLNFKPRTSVSSLAELESFLSNQLKKDEMSVIVSFFEDDVRPRRNKMILHGAPILRP